MCLRTYVHRGRGPGAERARPSGRCDRSFGRFGSRRARATARSGRRTTRHHRYRRPIRFCGAARGQVPGAGHRQRLHSLREAQCRDCRAPRPRRAAHHSGRIASDQCRRRSQQGQHRSRFQRHRAGARRKRAGSVVRRSGRVTTAASGHGRTVGRPQRRPDLHRRIHRRESAGESFHPRSPHQLKSVLARVRSPRFRPHRDLHQAGQRYGARPGLLPIQQRVAEFPQSAAHPVDAAALRTEVFRRPSGRADQEAEGVIRIRCRAPIHQRERIHSGHHAR